MKHLTPTQTQQVAGGFLRPAPRPPMSNGKKRWDDGTFPTAGDESNAQMTSPSAPAERMWPLQETTTRLNGAALSPHRFDENFLAPSDSLSDDTPLFAGINDQGGIV